MKKILFTIILLIVCPLSVNALSAETAIVMDQDSGRVLFDKSINKEKLIASTTKIMTMLVVLENSDLNTVITVDDRVLKSYGSAIYIEVGEKISVLDLLYGLILRSGNDAAIVLADYIAGSMESFADMMNQKAKVIGMKNTIFYNSHGLEENDGKGNTSTAYDMALLTRYAMHCDTFREIFATKTWSAKTNYKTYVWKNKNKLLYSYEYTTGGKTGFTEKAKRTLVTTATKDNKNLIVVTLNDGNDFGDHKALYEQYFSQYDLIKILDKNDFKVNNEEYYRNDKLTIKCNYQILLTKEEIKQIKTVVELEKISWPKYNGRVGVVKVFISNDLVHEEEIYLVKGKILKKDFWSKIWNFIKFWDS